MNARLSVLMRQRGSTARSILCADDEFEIAYPPVLRCSGARAFNPHWGSCLREGNENSRFGEQVNDYADLYTSRVSNFGPYSPLRYFRAPRRPMPHEI